MARLRPSKAKINDTLKERLTPLFELDNGNVEVVRFSRKGGRVEVRFTGDYVGSPCRDTLASLVVKPVLAEVYSGIGDIEYVD